MNEGWRRYELLAMQQPDVKEAYQRLKEIEKTMNFDDTYTQALYNFNVAKINAMALLQEMEKYEQINS